MVRWACGLLAALVIGMPVAGAAQTIPSSEQPGRERERFVEPPGPKATPAGPTISLPSTVAPAGAAQITLRLIEVHIEGTTVYDDSALAPLYADLIGREIPLSAIYDLAQRITAKYGEDGYILSRAIVPPQELEPSRAIVRLQAIEGYIDRVQWPAALSRYRDFFSGYAAKITAERPVNIRTIERYLLLAGDLPGFEFSSSLTASADQTGASTLVVEVAQKPLSLAARMDNRGTEARGPYEFLSSISLDNVFGIHESLSFSYAGTLDVEELQYASLGYTQVLNSDGLTAFADVSYSWGNPGTTELQTLEFESRSLYVDAGLSRPLIRSRERNLTLSGLFFLSDDEGDILAEPSSVDRLRGIRFKAYFDQADRLNGVTQLIGTFSQGIDGLGSTENDNPDASRAAGRVDFTTIEGTLSRTQPIGRRFSTFAALEGQYALTPLLAPEECGYGGRDFGRAFDPSELTGDHCWEVLGELRYNLLVPGDLFSQLYSYVDHGRVYRIDPSLDTQQDEHGTSAGLGLRLGHSDNFTADFSAAKPLDGREDDDWRYFFIVDARF
jgi:hemolysin activation/secretion protein